MAYISFEPKDYFTSKLWTGTGSENAITGVGFQPDWVWIKNRTAAEQHRIHDAVRGTNKSISSDTNSSQTTTSQDVMSFNSDGFTLGTETAVNANGQNIVGWNWKANGAGSSNSDGSITSTVSANTTSGFSIVKFTGTGSNATVGHGLGVAPRMIIVKSLGTNNWSVYHGSLGGTKAIFMDITSGSATHVDYWNNTNTTSSVFSIGISSNMNHSSTDMIAYCFGEVQGFSKFSEYVGNGNADGTFIYTGFKPAFIIFKRSSGSGDQWHMFDNKRDGYNFQNNILFPDASSAEQTSGLPLDILSNGFKLRSTGGDVNGSGETYIYMAFAEEPLVSSNGIPATAR
jgi:hypothetical protein